MFLAPQPVLVHTYYFPYVPQVKPIGVAWYATPYEDDARKIGAYWYYNSSSHKDSNRAAIPIIRPTDTNISIPEHYSEWLLVGNEGEGATQDNLSPVEMARFIKSVRLMHPVAYLVCLNSYDIDYMLLVLELLPDGTCQAVGVHITHLIEGEPVSSWLDKLCQDCTIWVTEIGWSNNDPAVYDKLRSLVMEAQQDSRVYMIFAYTTTQAHDDSVNMIDSDGELLPNGKAFKDAIEE